MYKDVTSIAIGGFDGMHLGHQQLFNQLDENGVIVVIESGYANLTPAKERENFTKFKIFYIQLEKIRKLNGKEFLNYLKDIFPSLKKIVVGYDFHFGKDRKCSFNDLKKMFSGEVIVVDEVKLNNDSIHSHKIRAKLQIGDIEGANAFLGHNYTIKGKHIRGQGIGSKELVATINIEADNYLIPKEGVYATLTRVDNDEHLYPSVSFIGHRVSTDGSFAIESHILDTKVDCQERAEISFISYLRENRKFNSLKELKEQIKKDIELTNKRLKKLKL